MTSRQKARAKERAEDPLSHSLDELEGPLPRSDRETGLMERVRKAWGIPLNRLSSSQLRLLAAQGIGTRHVVPLALQLLERSPLVETDFYPGDLLLALRGASESFWRQNRSELRRAIRCVEQALHSAVPNLDERVSAEARILLEALVRL